MIRQYTRKAIVQFVLDGIATDVTKARSRDAIPERYELVGYSKGIYGCTGKVFKGESGRLYAVTCATSALYMF